MRRTAVLVFAALSILLVGQATIPVAVADHDPSGGLYLNVVEVAKSDTVVDLGEPGDSTGDLLTFHNRLTWAGGGLFGYSHGSCIRIDPSAGSWECSWTNRVVGSVPGQIMVAGTFHDSGRGTMAIVGGTAAYRLASGVVRVRPIDATHYRFEFVVDHVFNN